MIAPRYIPLVVKQVLRHRVRTALTVLGVATAMFLFIGVRSMEAAVTEATQATGKETTLVVYRRNRFCPFTSRLPEGYERRIAKIAGVASVVPMKIVVNNCQASLDSVTFRGVPREKGEALTKGFTLVSGSLEEWTRRSDAALVGEVLALRRRVSVGQTLTAANVTVYVAGIVRSEEPQDQNAAYVGLEFLQRAAARGGDGIVTQFNVKVDEPAHLERVAAAIDEEFRSDQEPTDTRAEKAFVARAAHDLVQIVGFVRYLGWAAIAAVLALVSNAIVLSVQDRVKEHAVLQTLGYRSGLIARLIVCEGLVLGTLGGVIGTAGAMGLVWWGHFSLTVEATSMNVRAEWGLLLLGLGLSAGIGIVAGLVPAFQASRREIAASFRAV
jgi:putative ABC transport system permease protein